MECRNPEVDYQFLDHFNWEEKILPFSCNHFDPIKDIIELQDINEKITHATAEVTLAVDFVVLRCLIYKSKLVEEGYYCQLPGEKTSSDGKKYYGVSFGSYNFLNESNIMEIKKTIVDLYLYYSGKLDLVNNIFDNEYDIFLTNYIICGSTFFNDLFEDVPF